MPAISRRSLAHPRRGSAAGRSRSSSHRGRGCRCRHRRPPAPPACRDSDSPQPRSRGSMYCIWASSTCALPSRLLACWAKMSRISAVRSTTLTLTTFSSWLSWPGRQLAVADHGVGAGRGHDVARARRPCRSRRRWRRRACPRRWISRLEHLRAGRLGQRRQLGQRPVGVDLACPRSTRRPARPARGAAVGTRPR